jgi:hypothetical protein
LCHIKALVCDQRRALEAAATAPGKRVSDASVIGDLRLLAGFIGVDSAQAALQICAEFFPDDEVRPRAATRARIRSSCVSSRGSLAFKYLTSSAKYLTINVKQAMGGGGPSVLNSSINWFASSMSGCSIPWRSCWKAVKRSNPRGP